MVFVAAAEMANTEASGASRSLWTAEEETGLCPIRQSLATGGLLN